MGLGGVFNIASGTAITMCELARILQQITNKANLKPIFTEGRSGDISHCSGEISKAEEVLGFYPRIRLEDGLSRLVRWRLNAMRAIK